MQHIRPLRREHTHSIKYMTCWAYSGTPTSSLAASATCMAACMLLQHRVYVKIEMADKDLGKNADTFRATYQHYSLFHPRECVIDAVTITFRLCATLLKKQSLYNFVACSLCDACLSHMFGPCGSLSADGHVIQRWRSLGIAYLQATPRSCWASCMCT